MEPSEATDAELVAEIRAGNREAFGTLYDRYARLVRAVAYDVCRDSEALADLTQDAFLRAYRSLGQLREPERFGSWLAGIARRVADERRRTRRRDRHVYPGNERIEPEVAGEASPSIDASDEMEWIMEALAEFDPRERLAIHAFYLEGHDADRAAELVGLSRSGIYALLARAVARLARLAQKPNTKTRP